MNNQFTESCLTCTACPIKQKQMLSVMLRQELNKPFTCLKDASAWEKPTIVIRSYEEAMLPCLFYKRRSYKSGPK